MSFTWNVRIRFVDTDASGRIHYTAMFRFFEAAEFEFLRARGVLYEDFAECGFPRVHVACDYTGATRCDDLLTIGVTVSKVGNTSFTWAFEARHDELAVASGTITVVCLSRATRRPMAIPAGFRNALV